MIFYAHKVLIGRQCYNEGINGCHSFFYKVDGNQWHADILDKSRLPGMLPHVQVLLVLDFSTPEADSTSFDHDLATWRWLPLVLIPS